MAIPFSNYVLYKSGTVASQVLDREMIARLFTSNELMPTDGVLEFKTLPDIGAYFGTTSQEYKLSSFYFSVKVGTAKPSKISFGSYPEVATNAKIFGDKTLTYNVSDFTSITDGAFTLTIGTVTADLTGLDFNSDVSLTDVATRIETAINNADLDPNFANATFIFDAPNNRFKLTSGATGDAIIEVTPPATGTNILSVLGLNTLQTIISFGSAELSPLDAFLKSADISQNFVCPFFVQAITIEERTALAEYITAEQYYAFHHGILEADISAWLAELENLGYNTLTLKNAQLDEYPELLPPALLAGTDFDAENGALLNYMYKNANLKPIVVSGTVADNLNNQKINYYGRTQAGASNKIDFYQQGVCLGLSSDPVFINILHNEIWLKSNVVKNVINKFTTLKAIPTNRTGKTFIRNAVKTSINKALLNGVILTGKKLSDDDIDVILEKTNDDTVPTIIEQKGYWIKTDLIEKSVNGLNQKIAKISIIYSTSENINFVEIDNLLI